MRRARLTRAVGRLASEDLAHRLRAAHDVLIVVIEALRAGRGIAVEEAAELLARHGADEIDRVLEELEQK